METDGSASGAHFGKCHTLAEHRTVIEYLAGGDMRYADETPDGWSYEVPNPCTHDDHVDYSEDRSLLRGNPLDVALWLLCSEGWLHDAWALLDHIRHLERDGKPSYQDAVRSLRPAYYSVDDPASVIHESVTDIQALPGIALSETAVAHLFQPNLRR